MVHLGVQHPLSEGLLQIVKKAVRVERRFGIRPRQQLIQKRVGNARGFASGHWEPPWYPLWPPKHGIADTPSRDPEEHPPPARAAPRRPPRPALARLQPTPASRTGWPDRLHRA